ncbi:hypothetical protein Tco_0793617 [Tanacetum coccineum]
MGTTDDQPNVKAAPKHDWFKKPERPLTPNSDWNVIKSIDFRPPQTWISKIAQAERPPLFFDELMSTPIDFSEYVMNHLKIDKLTQEHLVRPTFNLLKGTCKSRVELDKPLPLIMVQGRQVVHVDYFINNDLEYLRGGSSSKKYTTSMTKTKAAKYDIPGIEDMVPSLWNPIKVAYDRYGVWGITHWGPKRQRIYAFASNMVSKYDVYSTKRHSSNQSESYEVMFTRLIVILRRVEDLQLGVESYQKKLNITKPQTFKSDISNRTPYTIYSNPQRIINVDNYNRNMLMSSDELYKFSDGKITSVRTVLHDIASNLRMDYLLKRSWSNLDRHRSRIMIKAVNKLLLKRRLMRSLENFIGGIDYRDDLRLLERII